MKMQTSKERRTQERPLVPEPERLPYAFDLLYDLKTMRDVEDVAYGRPSRCNVTSRELAKVFLDYNIPIPKCLAHVIDERYAKEREVEKQPIAPEPYQHPKAIPSHVYMITRGGLKGGKYYAVVDSTRVGEVRLYNLDGGGRWSKSSAVGGDNEQWVDITGQVYLNTDELEEY